MRTSIIGAGVMGKWFAKFSKDRKWKTTITDIEKEKARRTANELGIEFERDDEKMVGNADIVIISVPIGETPKVIEKVSDYLKDDSLLMDIASVKEKAVQTMRRIKDNSELVSIHPLFGPGAKKLVDKNIISIPVKVGEKYNEIEKTFKDLGANLVEMDEKKHDQLMAVTQSLTHFTLLTYFSALDSMENFEKALKLQTPMFQGLINLTKAFLTEDPELCGAIQKENSYSTVARSKIKEASSSLDKALEEGNLKLLDKIFENSEKRFSSDEMKSAYKELYEKKETYQ